ncbi:MAG TPA: hypothetical protein VN754_00555 [Candidatus Binataceae bacterium]|nr:hypothetical protein [Candidatus Binataceae bacterium]
MKLTILIGLAAGLLPAGGNSGLPPRGSCSEYAACVTANGLAVGAAAVSPAQAKRIFAVDLDRAGYLVFEVAVYPANGVPVDLALQDFELRAGSGGSFLQAAEPGIVAVAAIPDPALQNPPAQGTIRVVDESTIGYSTGGYGRKDGVYTGESVGVTNYPAPPAPPPTANASKDHKRDDLEAALAGHAIPIGGTSRAIAGYLYFPKPGHAAKVRQYQLTWSGTGGPARMTVPSPK